MGKAIIHRLYPNEYHVWQQMKNRILNKNYHQYHYYGGRGINMDPNWINFYNFYDDIGERPSLNHTLDRIDNNKGYWKWNCKWATKAEQMHNRRDNILSEIDIINIRVMRMKGFMVKDIAEIYGIRPDYASAIICKKIWKLVSERKELF